MIIRFFKSVLKKGKGNAGKQKVLPSNKKHQLPEPPVLALVSNKEDQRKSEIRGGKVIKRTE